MDMAPAGDAVADAGAANALDEAMHDHDAAADSEDELQTTMPNGLQLTKSNTVNPALQLAFRVPLSSAHRARARAIEKCPAFEHCSGIMGSFRRAGIHCTAVCCLRPCLDACRHLGDHGDT
jgi:hypothetical protein